MLRNILLRSRTPLLEEEGKKLILHCRHPGLDTGASVQTLTGSGSEASASIYLGRVWSMTSRILLIPGKTCGHRPRLQSLLHEFCNILELGGDALPQRRLGPSVQRRTVPIN